MHTLAAVAYGSDILPLEREIRVSLHHLTI
jgi:hypothetical protein